MNKNSDNNASFSPLLLTLLSAVLFTLSFPNFVVENGIQGLSALALVPAFLAIARTNSRRHSAILGAIFGITSTCFAYFWLTRFQGYSTWTITSVSVGYACEYALVFLALRMITHKISYKKQALALAIIWTAYEYLKSIGFLGFPWTLLAQSIHEVLPLMQLARITGVWGISFLLALCNGLLYTSIRHITSKAKKETQARNALLTQWIALSIAFASTWGYGMYKLQQEKTRPITTHIPMVLIQQNIDSWEFPDTEGTIKNLENIIQKTKNSIETSATKPQLIVWSEGSLHIAYQPGIREAWDTLYATEPASLPFREFLQTHNSPLLTGSIQFDKQDSTLVYNSAILIHPNGSILDTHAKYQLVPFAERIPFYQYQIVRSFIQNVVKLGGTWARKQSFAPLQWKNYDGKGTTLQIGTPICFEDSFPYITRKMANDGAQILINLTNVSWSKMRSTQVQQLAAAKFRSIETGLPLVRSTNSGVTTMINPWGRIGKSLPMFTEDALHVEVPLYEKQKTPYLIIGDSFAHLMVLSALCILFFLYKRCS